MRSLALVTGSMTMCLGLSASAVTLQVGPDKPFATPCAAVAAAVDGDIIEIDGARTYLEDVCLIPTSRLTLRGVGERPVVDANGLTADGKAIWVLQGNETTVENVELARARSFDLNGGGIRLEGGSLTVRDCVFRDNEVGILASGTVGSELRIERSEFTGNGRPNGDQHIVNVGAVSLLSVTASYFHGNFGGDLIVTHADRSEILYNRLTDEADARTNRKVVVEDGRFALVMGNLTHKNLAATNPYEILVSGNTVRPELHLVHNTMVRDAELTSGTFVLALGTMAPMISIRNNVLIGPVPVLEGTAEATVEGNFTGGDPQLENAASFDYRPRSDSPLLNAGAPPGPFAPALQYVHPLSTEPRPTAGAPDVGAYELPGPTTPIAPGWFRVGCGNSATPGPALAPAALLALLACARRRRR